MADRKVRVIRRNLGFGSKELRVTLPCGAVVTAELVGYGFFLSVSGSGTFGIGEGQPKLPRGTRVSDLMGTARVQVIRDATIYSMGANIKALRALLDAVEAELGSEFGD